MRERRGTSNRRRRGFGALELAIVAAVVAVVAALVIVAISGVTGA